MKRLRASSRFISALKKQANRLKRQLWALFYAWKDPRTPFIAQIPLVCALAYALSPIDLIPDFIPVLGYLDDLIILPVLIALAIKLLPPEVKADSRRSAWKKRRTGERIHSPISIIATFIISAAWVFAAVLLVFKFLSLLPKHD